jgi:hypothetical protein
MPSNSELLSQFLFQFFAALVLVFAAVGWTLERQSVLGKKSCQK